jgi:hypothetical protein
MDRIEQPDRSGLSHTEYSVLTHRPHTLSSATVRTSDFHHSSCIVLRTPYKYIQYVPSHSVRGEQEVVEWWCSRPDHS